MSKKREKIKVNDKRTFCGVSVACPTTEIPQKVLVLAVLLGFDTF